VPQRLPANKSAPPLEPAETSSRTGPGAPSKSLVTVLRTWWSNATKWTKVIFGVFVGLATIIAAVPVAVPAIMHVFHTPKITSLSQAAADAKTLNSLRPGELFSAFQSSLKAKPTVSVWGRAVTIKSYPGPVLITDYLFVLHTVYVEAFVGSNDAVDAYTITARTGDMPQGINILGQAYDLGKTTLDSAPLDGIALVAGVCSAHIDAYYEISGTDEAHLDETVAVGITAAGALPPHAGFPACPPYSASAVEPLPYRAFNSLAVAAGAPGVNPQSGYYRIEESYPTPAYLAESLSLRRKAPINTVTITAPGYPVAPEMISLHPQEVDPYAPHPYG
jgi:hypothetical protein